ncbi:MAG: IS110 family transposase [Mycobacterium sp.]|nr:IS110 family transposase [Mycobacterium sp.]
MAEPVEIPDADHEVVIERAAAIDVAKATGTVCVRLPGKSGRRFSRVWEVSARTGVIGELAQQLIELEVEKVTVESTSDYWRIWYYLLEAAGLDVQLVNARDAKNVPGRPKTDKLDAVWLAKLTEKGLLRPSFVPPAPIRRLRDYTRLRGDLTRDRSRYWQRLEKLLEDALIKVSSVASTLDTFSARDMIEALIAGERDPRRLAALARGRMKAKRSELITALDGRFDDHHAELARMLLGQIDALSAQIDTLTVRIEELIAELPDAAGAIDHSDPGMGTGAGIDADQDTGGGDPDTGDSTRVDPVTVAHCAPSVIERLDVIPGIGQRAAQMIIAESGRTAALLRRSPLRTVRATHRGTRLKQAARASRGALPATCVCELEARGSRRCVSGGFYCRAAYLAHFGGQDSRQRWPCGRRSATSVPTPVGTAAAGLR